MVKVTSYRKMVASNYLRGNKTSTPDDVSFLTRLIIALIRSDLECKLAKSSPWREHVPVKGQVVETEIAKGYENSEFFKQALPYIESAHLFVHVRDWRMTSRKCVLFKVRWDSEINRFRYV